MLKKVESDSDKKAYRLVKVLLEIRTEIERLDLEYERKIKPLREMQERVEAKAMAFLDANGMSNCKTEPNIGTLFLKHGVSVRVGDGAAFMDYIIQHAEYELLEARAHKTACREWVEEHGEPPPGVIMQPYREIQVRKPTP